MSLSSSNSQLKGDGQGVEEVWIEVGMKQSSETNTGYRNVLQPPNHTAAVFHIASEKIHEERTASQHSSTPRTASRSCPNLDMLD